MRKKKSQEKYMPINIREGEGKKRVFIFVIEHNTNTITILLPILYSNSNAIKFCLLTQKYARKKNDRFAFFLLIVFLFHRAEYKRKKNEVYIHLIFRAHSEELFNYYFIVHNSQVYSR